MKRKRRKTPYTGGFWAAFFVDFFSWIKMLQIGYVILLVMGFASSFIIWWYILVGLKIYTLKIFIVEAVVALIIIIPYLYRVFFLGYDDNLWKNFRYTWIAASLLSFIGFYISGVSFIGEFGDATSPGLYAFMRFLTNLFSSFVMSLIPALIITFVIRILVGVIEFLTNA